jgi:hypothetical protein
MHMSVAVGDRHPQLAIVKKSLYLLIKQNDKQVEISKANKYMAMDPYRARCHL